MCSCVCVCSARLLQALVEAVSLVWAFTALRMVVLCLQASWLHGHVARNPLSKLTIKAFSNQLAGKVSSFL